MVRILKEDEDRHHRREMEEVVTEYKLGILDPRRNAGLYERVSHAKKQSMGKKAVWNKIINSV